MARVRSFVRARRPAQFNPPLRPPVGKQRTREADACENQGRRLRNGRALAGNADQEWKGNCIIRIEWVNRPRRISLCQRPIVGKRPRPYELVLLCSAICHETPPVPSLEEPVKTNQ